MPGGGPEATVGWQTWQSAWETGSEEGLLGADQMALLVFHHDSPASASFFCLKSCRHQMGPYGKESLGGTMACLKQETQCGSKGV